LDVMTVSRTADGATGRPGGKGGTKRARQVVLRANLNDHVLLRAVAKAAAGGSVRV